MAYLLVSSIYGNMEPINDLSFLQPLGEVRSLGADFRKNEESGLTCIESDPKFKLISIWWHRWDTQQKKFQTNTKHTLNQSTQTQLVRAPSTNEVHWGHIPHSFSFTERYKIYKIMMIFLHHRGYTLSVSRNKQERLSFFALRTTNVSRISIYSRPRRVKEVQRMRNSEHIIAKIKQKFFSQNQSSCKCGSKINSSKVKEFFYQVQKRKHSKIIKIE